MSEVGEGKPRVDEAAGGAKRADLSDPRSVARGAPSQPQSGLTRWHDSGQGATWRSPRAWVLLLVVMALGTATDLWSKSWAFANVARGPVVIDRERVLAARNGLGAMTPADRMHAVPGVLDFTLVLNPGAVFGIGAGKRVFFALFTGLAIGFALWVFGRWTKPRDWLAHAGLGLLLAGGLGNLYDRVVFACVRDFIHPLPGLELPFGLRWPNNGSSEVWPWVSNVADAYLIVGIGLILWHSWRHPPEGRAEVRGGAGRG